MATGESPSEGMHPATIALYPRNQSAAELHRCVTLGARQHDLTLQTLRAHYSIISSTKSEVVAARVEIADIKKILSGRDDATKRLGLWLTLVAAILAPLLVIIANYITRPPQGPQYTPLTPEQKAQWERMNPKR